MKCEIIKDLLPAYCDCVCSVETAVEIEQHTQSCPDCKKLLENYRSDVKFVGGEPEKPFRKIKRSIFRSKSAVISLIILLVLVLSAVGYLTYGQIVRKHDIRSFETIISSQKAKKLVKKFCEGDIDYVMENIEINQANYISSLVSNDVYTHCRSSLEDFYEKYFKGKNLKVKIDGSGYSRFQLETGMIPVTDLDIIDGNSTILEFCVIEHHGGKFYLYLIGCNTAVSETDIDAVTLALHPIEPTAVLDAAIINYKPERQNNFSLFAGRFSQTPEEKQAIIENTAALMEDMYCEKVFYTNFIYDGENKRYLVDIGYIFTETSSGKQVMYSQTAKVKSMTYHFEVLPEFEPVIIDDGISAENRKKLENLFVY